MAGQQFWMLEPWKQPSTHLVGGHTLAERQRAKREISIGERVHKSRARHQILCIHCCEMDWICPSGIEKQPWKLSIQYTSRLTAAL